ncbi:uncharacterized protein PgNI_00624 [Pyricularia grisea]|uniref:Uncharacterized protein n=1 Tax=Pyricularia grisea TaxID=148305 RepID=A0A6P8BHL9_PYRGI|nr:uncharacterized protein PgNI_00624 [Pyricularia grisea]TLD16376.1 hypothetical protein PgNI_00624 [Pyricularia grisea]
MRSTKDVPHPVTQNFTLALLHPEITTTVFPHIRAIQGDGTILFHRQHMDRVEEPLGTVFSVVYGLDGLRSRWLSPHTSPLFTFTG